MQKESNLKLLLISNGIYVKEQKKYNNEINYDYNFICSHIDNLIYIQKSFLNCKNPFVLGLANNIWKDIEELKVWNRRAKNFINSNKDYNLEGILERAEKSILNIYKLNYIELIKRAMKRNEICVGKPFESNLWKDNNLNITDICKINFNMVEHDCYKYLSRIKRRNVDLEWENIVEYFINKHGLGNESKEYILSLLSYPYDSMKFIQSLYINNTYKREYILSRVKELQELDGKSLI